MSASRKLDEAQRLLTILATNKTVSELESFTKVIQETYSALLNEYNKKFGFQRGTISLAKFKAVAKKSGNIQAISFLIWYEKEYRAIRSDPKLESLFDAKNPDIQTLRSCSELLERTKKLVYYAYENF